MVARVALLLLSCGLAAGMRKRTVRKLKRKQVGQSDQRCTSMDASPEAVLNWFREPESSAELPWFNYILWLDQAALADGEGGLSAADPEALSYIPVQSSSTFEVNRCNQRQWSLYGNNISGAGDSSLTKQGSEFMRGLDNDRCTLDFDFNAARTSARISNYFWETMRIPLMDGLMSCNITLNSGFHRLFESVRNVGAADFSRTLEQAAEAEGFWGRKCCPGAFSSSSGSPSGDVLATCGPPLIETCALWHRTNSPAAPGFGGYPVYAVAYDAGGAWKPLPAGQVPQCRNCGLLPNQCWGIAGCGMFDSDMGYCSNCNSIQGTRGACCMPGYANAPEECKSIPASQFEHTGWHTCVLADTPTPESAYDRFALKMKDVGITSLCFERLT